MNKKIFEASLILSAMDKASAVIAQAAQKINNSLTSVQKKSDALAKKSKDFGTKALGIGVAAGAALAVPLKFAMEYEQSLARLGALARANDAEMQKLNATALKLGADTQFSASQAAEAMTYMAQQGFKVNEIIGATPGIMDLAAAGAIDLATAADIGGNILKGFGLQAKDMARVNDILANTFTSSNTTLINLGESLKYVAPIAQSTGAQIQELAAMTGLLGNVGISGSQAGTTLRAAYLKLASPAKEAMQAMQALGVQTTDANGNLRSMSDVLTDMDKAMKGMGSGLKLDVLATVFGQEAASGMTELMKQAGSGKLQEYTQSLLKSGTATEVANRQMNTFSGSVEQLMGSLETLAIGIGNVLIPALTKFANWLVPIINWVGDFAKNHQTLTNIIVWSTAAVATLATVLGTGAFAVYGISTAVNVSVTSFKALQFALFAVRYAMVTTVIPGIWAAVTATWAWVTALWATGIPEIILIIAALGAAAYLIYKNWDKVAEFFTYLWHRVLFAFNVAYDWITGFAGKMYNAGANIINSIWEGMKSVINKPIEAIANLTTEMRKYLPFSPAKAGAFRDLHKVKISETIASAIKVNPLTTKMGNVMAQTAGVSVAPQTAGISSNRSTSFNYSPVITISASAATAKDELLAMLDKHSRDIQKLLEANNLRGAY